MRPRVHLAHGSCPLVLLLATIFWWHASEALYGGSGAEDSSLANMPQLVVDGQGFCTDVLGLAFSPNGELLVAAGAKEVRVWNLNSGELLWTLRGQRSRSFGGNCYAVCYSPDGEYLLVGVDDYGQHGSIRVYRTAALDTIDAILPGNDTPTKKLAFSRSGGFLAAATENGEVLVWDWPKRRIVTRLAVRDSRDTAYLLATFVSEDQLLLKDVKGFRVVSIPAGTDVAQEGLDPGVRTWLDSGPIDKSPKTLTTALDVRIDRGISLAGAFSDRDAGRDYTATIRRTESAQASQPYKSHRGRITAAALSNDARFAATADSGGEVHAWDIENATMRHVFRSSAMPIYRVAFTGEANSIALATKPVPKKDFKLNSYGLVNRQFRFDDRTFTENTTSELRTEVVEKGGRRLGTQSLEGRREGVVCSDPGQPHAPFIIRPQASATCLSFADPAAMQLALPVVLGDDGGALCCFDAIDGISRRWFIGHEAFVTSLSISDSGRQLATSSTDGTVRLWALDPISPRGDLDFDYLSNRVEKIDRHSSAHRAGIRVGDEVLGVDDYSISDLEELFLTPNFPYQPGDRARLRMKRGDREFTAFAAMKKGPDAAEPFLSLFLTASGDWIAWTPEGYYDASPGADRLIGWHVNRGVERAAEFSTVQQFWKELYRPDIIKKVLALGDTKQAIAEANADRGRTQPALDLRDAEQYKRLAPPIITAAPVISRVGESGQLRVQASCQSQNQEPITAMTVLVNGRPVASSVLAKSDGPMQSAQVDEKIDLMPGENRVTVVASNKSAFAQSPIARVMHTTDGVPRPRLFVLSVGISEYANQEKNLQFAHEDARAFASAMESQHGKLYQQVEVKVLVNGQATRKGVLDGLQWLVDSASSSDVSVIFFSTHGIVGEDGDFYLCTYEVKGDNLYVSSVPGNVLIDTLGKVKGTVVVFADACQSAGLGRLVSQEAIVRRVVTPEVGAVLFASSLPRQASIEDPSWKHGAFSKAILDSLLDRTADSKPNPGDGLLTIGELGTAVARRVKQLTGDQQQAVTSSPSSLQDFNFVELVE